MNCIANYPFIFKPLSLAIVLASAVCVAACSGGAIRFDAGNYAQVSVDENTSGVFWKTVARVEGKATSNGVVYKLKGTDASQFSINAASGELTFKHPADFEAPLDADQNNEYLVDIEASSNALSAVQNMRINVKDVTNPVITLVKPKLNENVGTGDSVEVDAQVRFYDTESNSALKGSDIRLNHSPLVHDAINPQLWTGKLIVPEGGIDLSLSGNLSNGTKIISEAKLFNKGNGINASYLKLVQGGFLYVFGSKLGLVEVDLNLNTFFYVDISPYIVGGGEAIFSGLDFNSQVSTLFMDLRHRGDVVEINFSNLNVISPLSLLSPAGSELSNVISRFTDANKRLISVVKTIESGVDRYRLFVQPLKNEYAVELYAKPLWDLPADVVRGTFKFLNIHGASKTYIVADERLFNGAAYTMIQGFGEDGAKRFETKIGPDISNMVVNEAAGVVYVAENHSSVLGKIKSINVTTGEVHNLIDVPADLALGAYSTLHFDPANGRLYIGDNVSDSIFVLDLVINEISALRYSNIPAPNPLPLMFSIEN
ncbi:MAG: cadherin repeat domain-containing protein [Moraxellaceae bacterium]|nr:MAG: cadherin repeat domain-containing protein [Moraxellaceae bacterium]